METVGPRLTPHRLVGLDTSVFVYLFEDSPTYFRVAQEVLNQIQSGTRSGVTSAVTFMEIIVKPLKLGNVEVADVYEIVIKNFPNLSVEPVDLEVACRAAQFRAAYGLKPADALQMAACQRAGATVFVTNDKSLRRVKEMQIIVLDDYIH